MKILAINSSYRGSQGYTSFLINKIFEGARNANAECEEIILSNLDIKRCTGCLSCQKSKNLFKCIYDGKDDAKMVFDKMRNSDIIIFGTPVYIFNMSGLLKNLFERLVFTCKVNEILIMKNGLFFHHIDKQLCSKPFVTLICQDNLEYETHKNILSYFKTYSKFMECKQAGSLIRRSGIFEGYGNDKSKLKQYPQLKDIYNAFYCAGVELARNGKITHKTQKKANEKIIKIPIFLRLMLKFKFFRESFQHKISQKIKQAT